ncbi:hypothetical protein KC866_02000 [Patescibacteria group bacterium]|nr:hypothetical protein [Patescibacteria group bacterium]
MKKLIFIAVCFALSFLGTVDIYAQSGVTVNQANLDANSDAYYTNDYAKGFIQKRHNLDNTEDITLTDYRHIDGQRQWDYTVTYTGKKNGKIYRLEKSTFVVTRSGGPSFPERFQGSWTALKK